MTHTINSELTPFRMPQLELQAVRRVLFFSAHEAAVMIGMVDEKTWLGWENGDQPIP